MKKVIALALSLVLVLGLCACSTGDAPAAAPAAEAKAEAAPAAEAKAEAAPAEAPAPAGAAKEDKDITIAVIPKALDNAIFLDAQIAAEEKGKELGINVQYTGSATSDAGAQVTVIEGLIEKGVDGMLISCNDADALKDVINRAVDQGIVVATFDSDSPDSKRSFYCGTNNYAVGHLSGEYIMKLLPEGGTVAILTGVLGAPNLEERIVGFRDAVEGSNIEILPIQSGNDDVPTSVDVVEQYTAANPDLGAWWFDGGWPFFSDPDALPELQKYMENGGHCVSIDTFYPMLQFVPLGTVDQLIGSNYTRMGAEGVETIYKLIKGEDVDLQGGFIDTGYELCDKTNVDEIKATKNPW